jgi:hypothetical protein
MDIEEGEKVLNTKLIIYDDATKGDNYGILTNVDTSVEVDIGCIRLIFLAVTCITVTCIKQSPVLRGQLFLVQSQKIPYELNLF